MIISCIFGKKFTKYMLHQIKIVFFTNNIDIKEEIINKGWNYVYVNKPLVNDIVSSLQSKYIKFF